MNVWISQTSTMIQPSTYLMWSIYLETCSETVLSHLRRTIRTNYSNPPAHGAKIVTTILEDAELRAEWEEENARMRARVHRMRARFAERMEGQDHVLRERGFFTRVEITPEQVDRLREEHAIYMNANGGINLLAMTEEELQRFCEALREVGAP